MNKDLTVGKPSRVLWQFCLPLFGSIIFQQLYNLADSFVAGKFIGEEALAAVGNSYEITLIFIAFALGCNIGCSVITSQLFGAKQYREMKTGVYTSLISSGALCAALMLFGLIFLKGMLRLVHTPENILADSALYLRIYLLGLPFVFFYNTATGIFSALGDSKTPFIFLAASSTINIGMNILFVAVFKMGVSGVAWATFICQGVSCILAMTVVFRRFYRIKTEGRVPLFSCALLKRIAIVAVPSIAQQSFISVGNVIIQGFINPFGSGVIAGYSAAMKMNNLVITAFMTFANGMSNFTAQNVGAQKPERIRAGFRAGLKMVWLLGLPLALAYFFGGRLIMHFFLEQPTQTALDTGVLFLRIVSPLYFVISIKIVADGVLRGMGRMRQFVISTLTDLTLRVVLAGVLSIPFGSSGIWSAWPFGWTAGTIISYWFLQRIFKSEKLL